MSRMKIPIKCGLHVLAYLASLAARKSQN